MLPNGVFAKERGLCAIKLQTDFLRRKKTDTDSRKLNDLRAITYADKKTKMKHTANP